MSASLSLTVVRSLQRGPALNFKELQDLLNLSAKLAWKNPVPGTIILHLIGDRRMRTLNHKYRGQDRVTDVLSFAYWGEEFGDQVLGEVFLAMPQLKRQATKFGNTLKQELELLFVHGLLHIYGYDHANERQLKIVEELQQKILVSFRKRNY